MNRYHEAISDPKYSRQVELPCSEPQVLNVEAMNESVKLDQQQNDFKVPDMLFFGSLGVQNRDHSYDKRVQNLTDEEGFEVVFTKVSVGVRGT